ncbi:MAG: Gfo/Idh/MocA family oxidoreductase [Hyphomicrobium sp.]|nr:Gfo/Idh/MocA family oxidoreductase [Hyphomicrobium sp.]
MTISRAAGAKHWPDDRAVRVGVIGVGSMGGNHLRVYETLKRVQLVGLYDPNDERAAALAKQYNCQAFPSLEKVMAEIDAASICAPSTLHGEIGETLLSAGIHCLIEKPLAATEGECLRLINAAARSQAKLLVGHIERFNPSVRQLSSMLAARGERIRAIDTRRLSSVSKRIVDVDVVADLMVHDLDIIRSLAGPLVTVSAASGVREHGGSGRDHVTALLDLGDGAMASATASRITQNTVRRIAITTDAGLIDVDYVDQSVQIYTQDVVRPAGPATSFGDYALDIRMERVQVRRTEPLQVELRHFIDVIRNDTEPLVTGEDGLAALRLVWGVHEHLNRAQIAQAAAE